MRAVKDESMEVHCSPKLSRIPVANFLHSSSRRVLREARFSPGTATLPQKDGSQPPTKTASERRWVLGRAQFIRFAYSSFDAQGKTIDSEGKLVWNVEELCDERLVVTIMSAPASISSERTIFLFQFSFFSFCHSGVAIFLTRAAVTAAWWPRNSNSVSLSSRTVLISMVQAKLRPTHGPPSTNLFQNFCQQKSMTGNAVRMF